MSATRRQGIQYRVFVVTVKASKKDSHEKECSEFWRRQGVPLRLWIGRPRITEAGDRRIEDHGEGGELQQVL